MSKFRSNDSRIIPYLVARGEPLLQDQVFAPGTIKKGLDILASEYGAGALAYTPEVLHQFEEVLQRRYNSDDGQYRYEMPHSAIYDDPELAAFFGVENGLDNNLLQTDMESLEATTDRLVRASAKEVADILPGLFQLHENFSNEEWARISVADEAPFVHQDPDVTLFRNPQHEKWNTMQRPVSTSEKTNTLDLSNTGGFDAFARPHEGWEVDQIGGFYNELSSSGKGF